jgi:uncharacterized damage-inducible protein DinB
MNRTRLPLLTLALAAFTTAATSLSAPAPARAADAPAAVSASAGFLADAEGNLTFAEGELVQLAEAVPAEKWAWRPAEGVRSYVEVTLHVAGGNYFLATFLGSPIPEGVDARGLEKSTTDKAKAIETMKTSYVHVKKVIAALSAADLDAQVDFFGKKMTKRGIVLAVIGHSHEHLGQSIAYARSNGVVPPWSK